MTANCSRKWIQIVLLAALAGCAARQPAPVIDRAPLSPPPVSPLVPLPPAPPVEVDTGPETYTVKTGDTLYKIALDHGLDYRELAAWNNVENANVIRVGQVLRVRPPGEGTSETGVVTAPLKMIPPVAEAKSTLPSVLPPARTNNAAFKSSPKAVKLPFSEDAYAQLTKSAPPPAPNSSMIVASAPPSTAPIAPPAPPVATPAVPPSVSPHAEGAQEDQVDWSWPTTGKVVTAFNDSANLKGVDISGKSGQPVIASAAGKVVYAGSGLRGYGKLV